MRIGIITFHQALNYGAFLQMYALQKYLKKNFPSEQIEIVRYESNVISRTHSYKNKKGKNFFLTILVKLNALVKEMVFSESIRKYIDVSKMKYTKANIYDSDKFYDVFIAGSDQIWNVNLTGNDLVYFLCFTSPIKRYSYAASVGLKSIPEEIAEKIQNELILFNKISVREISSKETLKDFSIPKNINVNIDPTLLLEKEEWEVFCKKQHVREKYIFVYAVEKSLTLLEKAKKFANEKKMKLIYVGPFIKDKNISYYPTPSINKLIELFRDSTYILTNSFHGTVFSIIFRKKFFSFLEFSDGRNGRVIDLLNMLALAERMDISNIENEINWEQTNFILQCKRKETDEYFQDLKNEKK